MKHLFRSMTAAAFLAGGLLIAAENKVEDKDLKTEKAEKAEKVEKAKVKAANKAKADEALTPEQRQAIRKEALAKREARIKTLKEKKVAGTLTEKEQQQLERLEKGGRPGGGGRAPRGKKAADDKEK